MGNFSTHLGFPTTWPDLLYHIEGKKEQKQDGEMILGILKVQNLTYKEITAMRTFLSSSRMYPL